MMMTIALIVTLGERSDCVWNSLLFSYLASHSESVRESKDRPRRLKMPGET